MKEFKTWLEKQKPYDPFCCALMSEKAWIAALKWALTTQGRFDHRFSSMISPTIIEKELNEN